MSYEDFICTMLTIIAISETVQMVITIFKRD